PPPGCRTGSSAPTPSSCCSHLVDGQHRDPTVVNCPVVNHPVDYSPRGACETLLPIRETGVFRIFPRADHTSTRLLALCYPSAAPPYVVGVLDTVRLEQMAHLLCCQGMP